MWRCRPALLVVPAGLVLAGCRAEPPPSVVLWIVDTLRVDRLGAYGFDRPVSPNYDALAEQSTVFDAAFAQSSWTRPTVASILTGVGPLRHGELASRGLDPAIIVVADHGEAFGEHGLFGHLDLHAEMMRVPLMIRLPGQTTGRRSGVPVSQVDLAPTIVDLAGGAQAPDRDGESLAPLLGDRPTGGLSSARTIVSVSKLQREDVVTQYSLVIQGWRLLWTPDREAVELFSWRSREGERANLADDNPAIASGMLHNLQQAIKRTDAVSAETELDDETRRQLKAMGYIE